MRSVRRPVLQASQLSVLRFPVLSGRLTSLSFDRIQDSINVFSVRADAAASQVVVVGTSAEVMRAKTQRTLLILVLGMYQCEMCIVCI